MRRAQRGQNSVEYSGAVAVAISWRSSSSSCAGHNRMGITCMLDHDACQHLLRTLCSDSRYEDAAASPGRHSRAQFLVAPPLLRLRGRRSFVVVWTRARKLQKRSRYRNRFKQRRSPLRPHRSRSHRGLKDGFDSSMDPRLGKPCFTACLGACLRYTECLAALFFCLSSWWNLGIVTAWAGVGSPDCGLQPMQRRDESALLGWCFGLISKPWASSSGSFRSQEFGGTTSHFWTHTCRCIRRCALFL